MDLFVLIYRKLTEYKRHKRDVLAKHKLFTRNPFVSIIVPGKNEGEHIFKLTHSLKEQTYKNFELVIIDDGSDDDTPFICRMLEKNGFISRYYRAEERGGKASAANMGLMNNRAEFIVHLDADSSLDRNAIEEILLPFYWDDAVKAVGGSVKVRNDKASLCTTLQALEYLESIMVGRTVTSQLGMFRTISGAFGAFDSATLKQLGGWDIGPGLDGDITQKIRKAGHKVVFNHKAVCLTNVPVKFFNLFKQRLRWSKSLVRFRLRKHRDVLNLRNANFRVTNFLTNLDNLLFNFFFDFVWLYYLINLIVNNSNSLLELFLLKFIIMIPLGLISFAMILLLTERKREELYLIIYMPLQTFYSGYFLRVTRIISSVMEFFFFSSYKDPWNPSKSSVHARDKGM